MDACGQQASSAQPEFSYLQDLMEDFSGDHLSVNQQDLDQFQSGFSVCDVSDQSEPNPDPELFGGSDTNPTYLNGNGSRNLPSGNASCQALTPSDELETAEMPCLPILSYSDLIQTVKPPYSFMDLIMMALDNAPEKKLTLYQIYGFVADKFPFYRMDQVGWQNSIRHTLSVNHCFKKVARDKGVPVPQQTKKSVQKQKRKSGIGSYWMYDQSCAKILKNGKLQGQRKRYNCDNKASKKLDEQDHVKSLSSDSFAGSSSPPSTPALEMSPRLISAINGMMSNEASAEVAEDLSPSKHYYTKF